MKIQNKTGFNWMSSLFVASVIAVMTLPSSSLGQAHAEETSFTPLDSAKVTQDTEKVDTLDQNARLREKTKEAFVTIKNKVQDTWHEVEASEQYHEVKESMSELKQKAKDKYEEILDNINK